MRLYIPIVVNQTPDPRQPDNNIILNIASKFAKNKMELMFSI